MYQAMNRADDGLAENFKHVLELISRIISSFKFYTDFSLSVFPHLLAALIEAAPVSNLANWQTTSVNEWVV